MVGTAALQQALQIAFQHHRAGQLAQAETLYRQFLTQEPGNATVLHLLGLAQHQMGHQQAALDLVQRAIQIDPHVADAHNTLGEIWRALGQLDQAAAAYQAAIRLDPNFAGAYSNLGTIHFAREELGPAIAAYQKAVELSPGFTIGYYNLGVALGATGKLSQAIEFYRRAIELQPDLIEAHANLARSLSEQGRVEEAIERYRIALRIRPDRPEIHSSLLINMLYDPRFDTAAILQEHARWSVMHADRFFAGIRPHTNTRDKNRRLRIGYVSPDFRDHVVGYLFEPVLSHHDHERFEITCYSHLQRPDEWTKRIMGYADRWRDITGLSDEQAAELIRSDGIDILVDLALHLACNRLLIFARKPAPVQVTYLGYAATTGLPTMDYRLTDSYMDPPEELAVGSRQLAGDHTANCRLPTASFLQGPERLIHLPDCYWCYRPHPESPPIIDPPARRLGRVTFGSTNNFAKVNRGVIETWAAIVRAIPHSRLLIIITGGNDGNGHVHAAFARHGIPADRLTLIDRCPLAEYLQLYQQIDIALDPFPYNGGTTSLDSLWMGAPVVTLAGHRAVSRAGLTLLSHLKLPELVAQTPQQYVQIACDLAGDLDRLTVLRHGLRERMRQSPLLDEVRFTRAMEAAYRKMWAEWCGTSLPSPSGRGEGV